MSIVNTLALESNRQIKINFYGGVLSSDAGLLLIKELKQINQLESETIQTGEHLIIPYYTTEFPQ